MSPDRDADATARWLHENLASADAPEPAAVPESDAWRVEEFPIPRPEDLPHDVAVDGSGRVVVTGMFSHALFVLDPGTGSWDEVPIPVAGANPRAVEIGPDGAWWVVLGAPHRLARRDPATGEWTTFDVGVYAHEAAIDSAGRVWFDGHFTRDPEILGWVAPGSSSPTTFAVPEPFSAAEGSPIPYGLRAAPDGTIWMTELAGGRLVRLDPATGQFRLYPLPTPHSGPRRLDVAPDGTVWIPEFAGNRLARFDPRTERFEEFEFPIPDALPYAARVDPRDGAVWVSTAGAGVVARFDPDARAFEVVRLPTRDGIVRHLWIDAERGAVWGAYGSSPARSQMVFRIRRR